MSPDNFKRFRIKIGGQTLRRANRRLIFSTMSLRAITLGSLILVISVILLVLGSWSNPFLSGYVARYETSSAREKAESARMALNTLLRGGAIEAENWSAWGVQYDFAKVRDTNWERTFASPRALRVQNLDLLAVLDQKSEVRSQIYLDDKGAVAALPPPLRAQLYPGLPLLDAMTAPRGVFYRHNEQIWVLSAAPLAGKGTLIVGQRLTAVLIRHRLQELKSDAQVWMPDQAPKAARALLNINSPDTLFVTGESGTKAYCLVRAAGIEATPMLVVGATGAPAPARALLEFLPLALIMLGAAMLLTGLLPGEIYRYRLTRLSKYLENVRSHGQAPPLKFSGHDEWSAFGEGVNHALGALDAATRKHRQGEALQLQMAQLALGAGDAFWVWKVGAEFLEWHGDVDGMMGHSAGGMKRTFEAWMAHIHSGDQSQVRRACARPLRAGETIEVDFRVIRYDGQTRIWRLRGRILQRVFEADDRAPRLLAVCSDISDQRRDEEELRSSRQSLQRIFETAADAFMVIDAGGKIKFANAAAERIFALDRTNIEDRTIFDARWNLVDLQGEPFAPDHHPFQLVRATGEALRGFELRIDRADGRAIIVSLNAAPLLDNRGLFSGVVASVADITERRALEDRLKHQAFHDPLTRLANRVLVRYRLEHALQQRAQISDSVALIFIDLDNFKYINDSLGHSAGDELLIALADRLRAALRAGDTAARFGGDEFVILLEGLDTPQYAISVAERVLETLRDPFTIDGHEVFTTPSIGIAFSGAGGGSADELLRHADSAMYEAKRRGKARYAIYEASMGGDALKRLELENDLRRALQNGEFELYFQPTWDLNENRVCGFEALVRWNHPTRGLVMPGEFIALSEETGLIVPLGFQVLAAACAQAVAWNASSAHSLSMAVNISARQLHLPEVVPLVAVALKESGLDPRLLVLEITESAIIERTKQVLATMSELKKLGVSLAIDDFGTGYSSLAYLRAFPFDTLKIDRQFVSNIDGEPDNSAIVTSMVTLAHALKLTVVAEGAETREETEHLKFLSCDKGQGYFFGHPQPVAVVEQRFGLTSPFERALVLPVVAPEAKTETT